MLDVYRGSVTIYHTCTCIHPFIYRHMSSGLPFLYMCVCVARL